MNNLEKNYNYPKVKPEGNQTLDYFKKDQERFHSSNKLLLDIVINKSLLKKNNLNILEIGSYIGLFCNYVAKKLNNKSKIISIGDNWNKKSYNQFLLNTWDMKNKILPIKSKDYLKEIVNIYNNNINLDLIYIHSRDKIPYNELYYLITLILTLFPQKIILITHYINDNKVFKAIENLRQFIIQKNIINYGNSFLLNNVNDSHIINIIRDFKVNYNPNYNNKVLLLVHNDFKFVEKKNQKKLYKNNNIFYHYLTKYTFNGAYLNCYIDYLVKEFNITNIILYDLSKKYNKQFESFIFTEYNNILYFDSYNNKLSSTFMINYNFFKAIGGFENIFEYKNLIDLFIYKILINNKNIYKPLYIIINEKKDIKKDSLNEKDKLIINVSNYNNINYRIDTIESKKNIINVYFDIVDFNYNYTSNNVLKPLLYTIFPINKNQNSNKNILSNNVINDLRKNKAIKTIDPYKIYKRIKNKYNSVLYIFFNYINNKNPNILLIKNINNKLEEYLETINLFYKKYNLDYKINKNYNYDILLYYKLNYTKDGMYYHLDKMYKMVDKHLKIKGYLLFQLFNMPKKNDVKDLLKIFGKFEKIIILKVSDYKPFNNNFWILCYNKLESKDYKKNIYDTSFYDVLNQISEYKNNYRYLMKKISNSDDFNYY
jgi:hypothetical protein